MSTIKIVSGKLNAEFYDDERVRDALTRALDRGVKIYIIHEPEIRSNICSILKDNYPEQVYEYEIASADRRHFMVIDRKHVRVEEPHEPGSTERQAYLVHDSFFLGKRSDREFEQLKDQASTCTMDRGTR